MLNLSQKKNFFLKKKTFNYKVYNYVTSQGTWSVYILKVEQLYIAPWISLMVLINHCKNTSNCNTLDKAKPVDDGVTSVNEKFEFGNNTKNNAAV